MILDELLEFADATSVAGSTGTNVIGDVIDVGAVIRDLGEGEDINVVARIVTGIVAAGAGTVIFNLVTADNAALSTNPVTLLTSGSLTTQASTPHASVVAGTQLFNAAIPRNSYKRYLGITAVVAGNNISSGNVDAFLTKDVANWKSYPDAI